MFISLIAISSSDELSISSITKIRETLRTEIWYKLFTLVSSDSKIFAYFCDWTQSFDISADNFNRVVDHWSVFKNSSSSLSNMSVCIVHCAIQMVTFANFNLVSRSAAFGVALKLNCMPTILQEQIRFGTDFIVDFSFLSLSLEFFSA